MIGGVAIIIVILVVIGASLSGFRTGGSSSGSSTSSGGSSSSEGTSSGGSRTSSDPIEQARVVLGGGYSYSQVKSATDAALRATGTQLTDENRSRAWSAVLAVTRGLTEDGYTVDAMAVMLCVPGLGAAGGMNFADTAALCATDLALSP